MTGRESRKKMKRRLEYRTREGQQRRTSGPHETEKGGKRKRKKWIEEKKEKSGESEGVDPVGCG